MLPWETMPNCSYTDRLKNFCVDVLVLMTLRLELYRLGCHVAEVDDYSSQLFLKEMLFVVSLLLQPV